MTWQEWVDQRVLGIGATETSRLRTPERQRQLGGSPTSYHLRGTEAAPGAIDIGGTAAQLSKLFDEIKEAFKGRINELYLNIPGGRSVAIKDNRYLGSNPEAGRSQHLHVAIGGPGEAPTVPGGASGIPAGNRGDRALDAAPADVCARSLCTPRVEGGIGMAFLPQQCVCWSDVLMYGAAAFLVIGGALLVFRGKL